MKVRTYVLFVAVALLAVSAGTKNAKPDRKSTRLNSSH